MTKSKAQKMRVKVGRKGPQSELGILRAIATGKKPRKRNRKRKAGPRNLVGPRLPMIGTGSMSGGTRRLPVGVSMMSDGVNVGSVWKNSTAERVTFPVQREKFADLLSTGTSFQMLSQLFVNPGNQSLFPIFSQIAKVYEEYVPNVMRIYYRTKEYTASGSVVSAGIGGMAVDFDANDTNFSNMTQLENYSHSISGPPYSGIMVMDVLEEIANRKKNGQRGTRGKDLSQNNYFVYYSSNAIGPSTDQAKFYDIGNFQFAVDGTQAGIIGELWVEYSFTMIRRKSPEDLSLFLPLAGHFSDISSDATAASRLGLTPVVNTVTATGSTISVVDISTVGGLSTYAAGRSIGLNDGNDNLFNLPNLDATWLVSCVWSASTLITAIPAIALANGAAVLNIWGPADTAALGFFLAAGTSAAITFVATTTPIAVPSTTSNSVTLTGLTTMAAGNWDFYVVRLPDALITASPKVDDRLDSLERMVRRLSLSHPSWSESSDCEEKTPEPRVITKLSDSVVDLITSKLRK